MSHAFSVKKKELPRFLKQKQALKLGRKGLTSGQIREVRIRVPTLFGSLLQ